MVASLTSACATLHLPIYSEAMRYIPLYNLCWRLHTCAWGSVFCGAWEVFQKQILLFFNLLLLLLFRLTRNGRSFPRSYRHLTPERKTGHWLKFLWRNQTPLRLGPLWWTQKCTRWISAICSHRDLIWNQKIRLGKKMRRKMEPCTWLAFHYIDSGNGERKAMLSVSSLSAKHWIDGGVRALPFTSGTQLYSQKLMKSQNVSELV